MGDRVRRVLCAAEPQGEEQAIERLLEVAEDLDVQAMAVVGDIRGGGQATAEACRATFRMFGESGLPVYWVPGPADAPVTESMREAYSLEIVFPGLHGVHGTAAFAPGGLLFAGFGGEIGDDPDGPRDELERRRYPSWEPEYRLKLLRELDEHELVLLFSTQPIHKGRGTGESETVAELIGTYRPRLVVCGGERGSATLGRSLIVAPGVLADGYYAVADLHTREAELDQLTAAASRR